MEQIAAHNCICQTCQKIFPVNDMMKCVLNLDEDSNLIDLFDSFQINRVVCPKCGNGFTFEIPMLVYSNTFRFAIYINPSPTPDKHYCSKPVPTWLINDYKHLRKCMYLAEAVEKYRIFRDGFNDKNIEYLKFCIFPDSNALPFDEINLLYSHCNEFNLYFNKIDFNNNIIDTYTVPKSKIHKIMQNTFFYEDENNWQNINRLTIKDFIK